MDQYMEFARLQEGVLRQFTPRREILFAGQPFQAPENYLRNAELDLEGEKGNYNMIDGIVNNDPPVGPILPMGRPMRKSRSWPRKHCNEAFDHGKLQADRTAA
ncbi:MAG: DUF4316 domain-containing protein [[Clostridium] leptum]